MQKLLKIIAEKMKKDPSVQVYTDMYHICLDVLKTDIPLAVEYLVLLSDELDKAIPSGKFDNEIKELYSLHKKAWLTASPHHFESFLLYIESNREPAKKFYPPRRKVLKQVVDALQELEDDKLDLLAISLPPGSGKTTLAIFYLTWLAGKHSDEPMLTGSHSNSFVRGVYDECLRILDPVGEYLWHDVFPAVQVSSTNAKDCRIDLMVQQPFALNRLVHIQCSPTRIFHNVALFVVEFRIEPNPVGIIEIAFIVFVKCRDNDKLGSIAITIIVFEPTDNIMNAPSCCDMQFLTVVAYLSLAQVRCICFPQLIQTLFR